MGGELRTYSTYNEQVSNNNFGNFQFTGTFTAAGRKPTSRFPARVRSTTI